MAKLFSRVYSPFSHLVKATRGISKSLFSRSGRIIDNGLGALDDTGRILAKEANATVRNVTKRRAGRRTTRRSSRKAGRKAATRRAGRR